MNKKIRLTTNSTLGQQTRAKRAGNLSEAQVRRLFSSAQSLGVPSDEVRLAYDSALNEAGVFGLIQHSINLGQLPITSFMGYAALQQIQQNSMLRTVIEIPIRDMMQPGFELKIDNRENQDLDELKRALDPDGFEEDQMNAIAAIEARWDELRLNEKLTECLKLSDYEGGALLFIDTGTRGDELLEPLDLSRHSVELSKNRPLKFKVIDPINIFPGNYNASDAIGDNYFEPQTWWILGQEIHVSRLIKFAPNEAPLLLKPAYNFLGIPLAQMLWDFVIHWNQNRESANRLLNKFSLTAFKTNMEDILSGGLSDDLNRRIDYLAEKRSNDGILLMDKESEDVVNITTPLSGVTEIVKQSLESLAIVSHIPAVVLFGQSPQGFNATGESDIRNYTTLIEARRERELKRPITQIVDLLRIKYTKSTDRIVPKFLPFDTSQSLQNAQTEMIKAQTAATRIQAGVTSAEEERQRLSNDRDSSMQFIDVDELPEPPQEGDLGGGPAGESGTLPDDFMQEVSANAQNTQGDQAQQGDAIQTKQND